MARKPKGSCNRARSAERTFDEHAFIDGVFNNDYILVVGNEIILDREKFPDCNGDINQYIINEINNDLRQERANFVEYRNFTDIARDTPLNQIDRIYSLLTDGYEYLLSDISPELTNLLRSKLFRFVLTTCIDSYLEMLMRDIWGDELRIVNISDYQSLKDFQDSLERSRVNKYSQPTLFYAFGKVIKGRPKPRGYVETDVDAIKIIEKWLMRVDTKYIVPFLKEKRLLALGCKFDDWFFRFFWYILTRSFDDNDREGLKDIDGNLLTCDNLAAMFNPDIPSDHELKNYLQRRGVCMHNDVWQFMEQIYTLLTSTGNESPFHRMIKERRRKGGIFISYKSTDAVFANEIFCKLARENGLNVWLDNVSLNVGDDYKRFIHDAIRQAHIFIPILSPHVASDLEAQGNAICTFYSDEWRWAANNKNIKILPVAIDGYDVRNSTHKIFEEIIGNTFHCVDMTEKPNDTHNMKKLGYAKLLESITNHLENPKK